MTTQRSPFRVGMDPDDEYETDIENVHFEVGCLAPGFAVVARFVHNVDLSK